MKYNNKISFKFEPLSEKLSTQLDALISKTKSIILTDDNKEYFVKQNRLFNILRTLLNILLSFESSYPKSVQRLLDEGLECLINHELWLEIEHEMCKQVEVQKEKTIKVYASIHEGLEVLVKAYNENGSLNGPWKIKIDEKHRLDISKIHTLPFQYVKELRAALQLHINNLISENVTTNRIRKSNQQLLTDLISLIQSEYFRKSKYAGEPLAKCLSDLDWLTSVEWVWASEYSELRESFFSIMSPSTWRQRQPTDFDKSWRTKNKLAIKFKPISLMLYQQVSELFNYSKNEKKTDENKEYFVAHTRLMKSSNSLLETLKSYQYQYPKIVKRLIDEGFDLLIDHSAWKELEHELFQKAENLDKQQLIPVRIYEALETLTKLHFKDENLKAPWKLSFGRSHIDFSRAYKLPFRYVEEIRPTLYTLLIQLNNDELDYKSIRSSARAVTDDLVDLIESDYYQESRYKDKPLTKCLSDKAWMTPVIKRWDENRKFNVKSFLKIIAPDIWGERRIADLLGTDNVWKFARKISPKFCNEIKAYWELNSDQAKDTTTTLVRVLAAEPELMKEVTAILKTRGIVGLADNDFAGFKIIRNKQQELAEQKGNHRFERIHTVAEQLYQWQTQKELPRYYWLQHVLIYPDRGYQDISFLYDNYPKIYEEVIELHQTQVKRIDSEKKSHETVHGWVASLLTLLKSYNFLTIEQKNIIARDGFKSLVVNKFKLLNTLRLGIQEKVKAGSIELEYGVTLQGSIDKFLEFYGLERSHAYKVHKSLRDKHAQQKENSSKNLYTMKEVVEIAYYMEVALASGKLTLKQKVELMLIKIQLKSGWNISYLSNIELDDVVEFDTPGTNSRTKAIRIFKKRANYSTQWHQYEIEAEVLEKEGVVIGPNVMPVWKDIQDVISLTEKIRDAAPDNPLANYIFIFDEPNIHLNSGKLKKISYQNTVKNVQKILSELGCTVLLSPRKVRKKGLNEHYRNVKKHFQKYQKAGQHSAQAFFKSYFSQEHLEVAQTMGRALAIMADYFLRDITDHVIILMNKPDGGKRTPNGYCTQDGDSKVANIFRAANKKLRDNEDTQVKQCADFGACLWCDKYRCVADAEHVWRLLSYRDHVLEDMKASTGEFQTETIQIEYINHLIQRVNDVLIELKDMNSKAVIDGEQHFAKYGIHPDWELASAL